MDILFFNSCGFNFSTKYFELCVIKCAIVNQSFTKDCFISAIEQSQNFITYDFNFSVSREVQKLLFFRGECKKGDRHVMPCALVLFSSVLHSRTLFFFPLTVWHSSRIKKSKLYISFLCSTATTGASATTASPATNASSGLCATQS
jgi:hypothetical protein